MSSLGATIEQVRQAYEGHRLSKQRLELVLFLIDWAHCVKTGSTVTGAEWNSLMGMSPTPQLAPHFRNALNHEGGGESLGEAAVQFCHKISDVTLKLDFDQLVSAVAHTYPMSAPERYFVLDLPKLAVKFKQTQKAAEVDTTPGL